ncbi:MAG: SUMF1/EgtB/PvdO family nonheme iron enzyme [Myxococcota bacterium]
MSEGPALPQWLFEAGSTTVAEAKTAIGSTIAIGSTTATMTNCRNGRLDQGEDCDGIEFLNDATCKDLQFPNGSLGCTKDCEFDYSKCAPTGMVLVKGGTFEIGSNEYSIEQPVRQAHVDTFLLDKIEVTVTEYFECVGNGGCLEPDVGESCNWNKEGREHHPIKCVTWFQANTFCIWSEGRLPTEAKWEKAARGTDARTYPWGDIPEPNCDNAAMYDAPAGGSGCGNYSTMEVGSKPQGDSPYRAQDMAGNVWEWVADWYGSYDARESNNPTGPVDGELRVLRGGS